MSTRYNLNIVSMKPVEWLAGKFVSFFFSIFFHFLPFSSIFFHFFKKINHALKTKNFSACRSLKSYHYVMISIDNLFLSFFLQLTQVRHLFTSSATWQLRCKSRDNGNFTVIDTKASCRWTFGTCSNCCFHLWNAQATDLNWLIPKENHFAFFYHRSNFKILNWSC